MHTQYQNKYIDHNYKSGLPYEQIANMLSFYFIRSSKLSEFITFKLRFIECQSTNCCLIMAKRKRFSLNSYIGIAIIKLMSDMSDMYTSNNYRFAYKTYAISSEGPTNYTFKTFKVTLI